MSRMFAAAGVGLAAIFGVATAYVALQPELKKQQEERLHLDPEFQQQHEERRKQETAISQAMIGDMKEAKDEALKSGFAWGIRNALFGRKPQDESDKKAASSAPTPQKAPGDT